MTCFHHKLLLMLHGEQNLATLLLASFRRTMLLLMVLLPIISHMFLHCRNAMIGGSDNNFLSLGFLFSMSHLSPRMLLILGSVHLNINTRGFF